MTITNTNTNTNANSNRSRNSNENILSRIEEGMVVYDSENKRLGTVLDLYFGASATGEDVSSESRAAGAATVGTGAVPALGDVDAAVVAPLAPLMPGGIVTGGVAWTGTFESEIPNPVRDNLLQEGFIKIRGGGILGAVWYAVTSQIASAEGKEVHLNVPGDQLTRR